MLWSLKLLEKELCLTRDILLSYLSMAVNFRELECLFYCKITQIPCPIEVMLASGILLSFLCSCQANEIMEEDPNDPVLELDDKEDSVNETKLPNAHSAGLVMGFILLSVFSYCVYRIIKRKCCPKSEEPTTVEPKDSDADTTEDSVLKQREAYLAIYGPKKNINSISEAVSKNGRTECIVATSRQ